MDSRVCWFHGSNSTLFRSESELQPHGAQVWALRTSPGFPISECISGTSPISGPVPLPQGKTGRGTSSGRDLWRGAVGCTDSTEPRASRGDLRHPVMYGPIRHGRQLSYAELPLLNPLSGIYPRFYQLKPTPKHPLNSPPPFAVNFTPKFLPRNPQNLFFYVDFQAGHVILQTSLPHSSNGGRSFAQFSCLIFTTGPVAQIRNKFQLSCSNFPQFQAGKSIWNASHPR